MKTVALLCDSTGDSANNSWLFTNAAIQLARICQSREHRLIVYANSSAALPVLLASSEYYRPASLESRKPYTQSTLFVRPFDVANSPKSSVEATFLFSSTTKRGDDEQGLLASLLYLARSSSETEQGSTTEGIIVESVEEAFERMPPTIVIRLGANTRLEQGLKAVSILKRKEKSVRCYAAIDCSDEFLSILSVLSESKNAFNWRDHFNRIENTDRDHKSSSSKDDRFSTDQVMQIKHAETLARYSLAFERIVDSTNQ